MNNFEKKKLFWSNKKVFITGHTGFKGSWLSFTLKILGAKVYGYSLKPPTNPSLFNIIKLKNLLEKSIIADVRNKKKLSKSLKRIKPDIIFHLAAQPLVLDSYKYPYETFQTNFLGTLNVLDCAKKIKNNKCNIIVTTDKVYKSSNKKIYNELDKLGVTDPYGSSKVTAEIVAESYIKSIDNINSKYLKTATVRAGNVVGGGDFSKHRLVPDYLKSLKNKKKLLIRNPHYIRPWQFVMEPIFGYLLLAEKIVKKKITKSNFAWNFAPKIKNCTSVKKFVDLLNFKSKKEIIYSKQKKSLKNRETKYLFLNSSKAKKFLEWEGKYNLKKIALLLEEWNRVNYKNSKFCREIIKNQILDYIKN